MADPPASGPGPPVVGGSPEPEEEMRQILRQMREAADFAEAAADIIRNSAATRVQELGPMNEDMKNLLITGQVVQQCVGRIEARMAGLEANLDGVRNLLVGNLVAAGIIILLLVVVVLK